MLDLNSTEEIKKIDVVNVAGSIEELSLQCQQAWSEVETINFPKEYTEASNIVFSGMGGSSLGAYVAKSLFSQELPIPFEIVNDYHLPKFVNSKSLVLLSSYSGTTEETLSCAEEALRKKALISGLTTGGKLASFLNEHNFPGYIFNPKHNPSNQPRMGLGYAIFGLISILSKIGLVKIDSSDLEETVLSLERGVKMYDLNIPTEKNAAKKMATSLYQRTAVVVSSEFLTNVGRVFRNQFHENAKNFAAFHDLPELNHHLMEGLKFPDSNKNNLHFLFLKSRNFSPRILKRFEVTKDVVAKNGVEFSEFVPQSGSKLSQVMEAIQFGSYITYYLALLYKIDPSKIPWVDYFKKQLSS